MISINIDGKTKKERRARGVHFKTFMGMAGMRS
jgi:hypothetical protein